MSQREAEGSEGHWTVSCTQRPVLKGLQLCTAQVRTQVCKDHTGDGLKNRLWKGKRTAILLGTWSSHHCWEASVILKMSDDKARVAGVGYDEQHQVEKRAGVENQT